MTRPISSRSNYSRPRSPDSRVSHQANVEAIDHILELLTRLTSDCCQRDFYGKLVLEIAIEDGVLQIGSLSGHEVKRIK